MIDSKTKFIDTLDRQNVAKNKEHNIETPKPITNFQDLISGVLTPKITAVTGKLGSLSGSFIGGSSGGAGSDSNGGGLGNIVSSLLRLSGPLLAGGSGSSSGSGSGGSSSSNTLSSDEDDDFN